MQKTAVLVLALFFALATCTPADAIINPHYSEHCARP